MIFVDTAASYALVDDRDSNHIRARDALAGQVSADESLVTHEYSPRSDRHRLDGFDAPGVRGGSGYAFACRRSQWRQRVASATASSRE